MTIDNVTLEALRKFNAGKNAQQLKADLAPGTYTVSTTVSLSGTLKKSADGATTKRNTSGAAHIARYLLDRLSDPEFNRLKTDLNKIRTGQYAVKDTLKFEERLDQVMPKETLPRRGSVRFDGELVIEDCLAQPLTEEVIGLRIVEGT